MFLIVSAKLPISKATCKVLRAPFIMWSRSKGNYVQKLSVQHHESLQTGFSNVFRTYRCRGALRHLQKCLQIPKKKDATKGPVKKSDNSICFTFHTPVTEIVLTCILQVWKVLWK